MLMEKEFPILELALADDHLFNDTITPDSVESRRIWQESQKVSELC